MWIPNRILQNALWCAPQIRLRIKAQNVHWIFKSHNQINQINKSINQSNQSITRTLNAQIALLLSATKLVVCIAQIANAELQLVLRQNWVAIR